MLIRDLEVKSGLDRATIRFYEKEGLITPERKKNGYRDYTDENLDHLMKIKLLRQLGMGLDKIKQLQQGEVDLQTVLAEQIRILERRIQEAQKARLVCIQMQNDRASYGNLDVKYYLNALNVPQMPPVPKQFKEKVSREYHPVRRLLARWMDYALLSQLLEFLLVVILRTRPYPDWISTIINYGTPFLMVPIGALMLYFWGCTPGKWCLGLHVESENGGKLNFLSALDREWDVLRYGYGFGIPFWSLWRLYRSYRDYQDQEMDWDWESEYCYKNWSVTRKIAAGGAIAVWILMILIGANSFLQPKYRGNLTVSEFSSNYNHYLQILDSNHDYSEKLQENGLYLPEPNNTVSIYVFGQPEKKNYAFDYVTEGERLKQICYTNSWTEVLYMQPIPNQCMIAALTAVMSQMDSDKSTMMEFGRLWDKEIHKESGTLEYNGVKISWRTEAENCAYSADGVWHIVESDQMATVSTEFIIELT